MTDLKNESVKDGFDLIEYPCIYKFKAVYKHSQNIEQKIRSLVETELSEKAVKGVKQRQSKEGRFVSVTIQAELINREQLEKVYSALKASEDVLMTL